MIGWLLLILIVLAIYILDRTNYPGGWCKPPPFLLPRRGTHGILLAMVIDLSDERIAQNIADNLHRLLRDRGINQSELARRAGISKMAVSRYLRLQIIPGSPALARMAHALCTTTDELVRDPKNPVPGLDRE